MSRRILILLVLFLVGTLPAAAQDDDAPAAQIEALALRVHHHNMRTGDFTVWTGGEMGNRRTSYPPTWEMGEVLDNWRLPGFDKGHEDVSWEDLTRPTLLNIWASWCPPCVQEFPDLTEIALHPDEHAYDVLFINSFDEQTAAEAFVEKWGKPGMHILSDPGGRLAQRVGSQAIPTSILLDADGTVLAIHIGSFTPAHQALFEMIAQHPRVGTFDAADYPDLELIAEIESVAMEDAAPVDFDEAVSGALSDDEFQHAYRFEGRAGDIITVTMQRMMGDLEPYLVLLDEQGERVAETSDYFYEPFAMLDAITLPADGTYVIVATRFLEADGLSSGKYELTITRG